ncbi:hypothetical protein F5Y04DRAFT_272334 [Hypomontagnella monticulosa]|nr:hypothetical protein F5Y04DRAFT_272334 [Hypomontagnella monticulosa]
MEHHRLPRHSSSHGTLHSSYSQGRPAHGPSPVRPLHKPLRSVNENSVLLPSPGALESMLKTTTETGDIGIFSIKPVPPSPQRRDTLSEIGQQRPSPRPSIDELRRRNNGKKPSSWRDTTSEIISMYGSDSYKSATSTLSPSEDIGQRSFSMTTCGSRHLSHHRSTTTLQSQTSGGPLQRPRSPFPYPTRLKRPGVRPASPALTEGGRVDYSRMVEIDRISHRTVHGPYRPCYPPMVRRLHPLGLRADMNQSTASLPPHGLPPHRYGPPGPSSIRTHSAASMASWSASHRERPDSSSRTSSLTSIVNMYHRAPHAPRAGPSSLSPAIPRYYDYTEAFESRELRSATPTQPLAPVPTHASNCRRPMVLQEPDENLSMNFGERDSAYFEPESQIFDGLDLLDVPILYDNITPQVENCTAGLDRAPSRCCTTSSVRHENRSTAFHTPEIDRKSGRGSDIDLLPSQAGRDSMDTFNPNLDLESKDAPTYRYTDYRSTTTPKTKANSPEKHVQVQGGGTPTIRSEQGVILRDDTQDEILPEEAPDGNDDADPMAEQTMTSSPSNSNKRRSCSEPMQDSSSDSIEHRDVLESQPKFATMSRSGSHYSKKDTLHDDNRTALNGISCAEKNTHGCDTLLINAERLNDRCDEVEEYADMPSSTSQAIGVAQKPNFQRHKRNQAVPRISTSSLPREDSGGFPYISPSCSNAPIVSPKPISPARQLRLKNSIPQLMKALPPLPGDPNYVPPPTPSIRSISSNEDDFAEVLAPFRFSRSSTLQLSGTTCAKKSESTPNNSEPPSDPQKGIPKLRLRMKMSNDSEDTVSSDKKSCNKSVDRPRPTRLLKTNPDDKPGIQKRTRNRLKLRSSKSTLNTTPQSSATVRRNAEAGATDIVADLARQKPRDLFTFPTGLSPALHPASTKPLHPSRNFTSSTRSTPDVTTPCQVESRFGPGKPSVRNNHYDLGSTGTRASPHPRQARGLKRRLSNLRYLLARPSDSVILSSSTVTAQDKQDGIQGQGIANVNIVSKNLAAGKEHSAQGYDGRAPFSRRVRSRLFKWVKDAKVAVRACTKRHRSV